ncbi:DUF308 domain-containing protein [Microbacterium sp. CJ77]|uniref:DUF308 domain-containing protein n=1 Tax=Microbacterium sp. CJ77 TaxID=2079201 RepID=UPI000CD92926|nr:acyl-CoA synthetase [Microbacterium sp. CJ77]
MSTASTATPASPPRFALRHAQLARAGIAAIAAIMVTFSPDHSAAVGLAVFSGFAIVSGLIELIAAWLTYPAGRRAVPLLLGALSVIAGMLAGIVVWRSTTFFFSVVISWALVTGLIEAIWALRERRSPALRPEARDSLVVGVFTVLLGLGLLLVPAQYALTYRIDDVDAEFTLTGITIAVGIFGGYAAIIAVFLGIAGFSPTRGVTATADTHPADTGTAPARREEETA